MQQLRLLVLLFYSFVGVVILFILQNPRGDLSLFFFGCIGLVLLWKTWLMTKRDSNWLAFTLLLLQLLEACFFLTDKLRPLISYGVTSLFCLPSIPILWRAAKARGSAFRLYLVFSAWCLVTVTYSLGPMFSITRLVRNLLLFGPIVVCSLQVWQANQIKPLIRSLMMASVVATLTCFAAALVLPHAVTWNSQTGLSEFGDEPMLRFVGLFTEPNQVGELTLVSVGLILTYFEFATRRERKFLGSIAVVAIALTIIADSRSDLVGLAIGSALYICWRYRAQGVIALAVASILSVLILSQAGTSVAAYISRGDIWTLTGRTELWHFTLGQIVAKPLTGYGYATSGAIFGSRYFPIWWGPLDQGPRSSLHNGYLSSIVGVGIPATIFWLFIMLRPWITVFSEVEDPWRLKRMLFFIVIPMLVMNIDESMIDDCSGAAGFLFTIVWAVAEQYRLKSIRSASVAEQRALHDLSPAIAALRSS